MDDVLASYVFIMALYLELVLCNSNDVCYPQNSSECAHYLFLFGIDVLESRILTPNSHDELLYQSDIC